MGVEKLELMIHDLMLKTPRLRHAVNGLYQRVMWLVSPKIKSEGNIRRVSPDDKMEYFFGYYDKSPWDESGRYMLCLRAKNTTKSVSPDEPAEIIRIDTEDGTYEKLAQTSTWNVQQGCMLGWLPDGGIIYNDLRFGDYRAVILSPEGEERVLDLPVYTVSQDGRTALSLDFSRLHRLRPGYGYSAMPDRTEGELCPEGACVWRIDIPTGDVEPVITYSRLKNFDPREDMKGAEHKVNHLMLSPSGRRFMMLHRWIRNGVTKSRLLTCDIDGGNLYCLSDNDYVSHCCWHGENEILSYCSKPDGGKAYWLMTDRTQEYRRLWPQLALDGHPTYSTDGRVVTDTYPDRRRVQSVYIMQGDEVRRVARVFSPFRYGGNVRCDLHPRWRQDCSQVCIDASFEGRRGLYIIDVDKD